MGDKDPLSVLLILRLGLRISDSENGSNSLPWPDSLLFWGHADNDSDWICHSLAMKHWAGDKTCLRFNFIPPKRGHEAAVVGQEHCRHSTPSCPLPRTWPKWIYWAFVCPELASDFISQMSKSILIKLPGGSDGKESSCNAWDLGSIPGLGRSPGEGKGYPLQYSGLENSMDSPWDHK